MQTWHLYKIIKIPSRTIIPSIKPTGHKTPTKPQRPLKHVLSGKTDTLKYKKAEGMINSGEWVIVND